MDWRVLDRILGELARGLSCPACLLAYTVRRNRLLLAFLPALMALEAGGLGVFLP